MTEAAAVFKGIFFSTNRPPMLEARKAPIIIPKLSTLVLSMKTDWDKLAALAPCQYPHWVTSIPKARAAFDPHKAKAEVTPQGCPRVSNVKALRAANSKAPTHNGHAPRIMRAIPWAVGKGAIL